MSRLLDDLSDSFKPKAIELIARCIEEGVPVMIIFTGRTEVEQAELYAQGRTKPGQIVTWTLDSKHVMKPRPNHPSEAKSDAIDIAPWEVFQLHGPDKIQWDSADPSWPKIGAIGQKLGLKWGVIKNGMQIDPGHFEEI
jgi:peptidoglycan L-alanyl-D-glutamate endopeptidase CwlK